MWQLRIICRGVKVGSGKKKSNDGDAYTNPASTPRMNHHKQQIGIAGIIKNNNSSEKRNQS